MLLFNQKKYLKKNIFKWFNLVIFIILNNIINSDKNPLVFIFIIHFINLKLTYYKGAKIDDVMANLETTCFRLKMAIIIT